MAAALAAFFRALVASCHPRMLLLTLLPLGVSVGIWVALILFAIDPLLNLSHHLLMGDGHLPEVAQFLSFAMGVWVKLFVAPLLVFVILWPLVLSTAVAFTSIFIVPYAVDHVQKQYPNLQRLGKTSMVSSIWFALKTFLFLSLGWLLTLPLWLIPGVAFFMPFVWTAYFLVAVMSYDCLLAHATHDEYRILYQSNKQGAWLIGLLCAVLSAIPPFFLLMPILSALAFGYFYLNKLDALRHQSNPFQDC